VVRSPERTKEGYGVHVWTTTPPPEAAVKTAVDVAPLRAELDAISALTTDAARREYYEAHFGANRPARQANPADVAALVSSLDARGAWVSTDVRVHVPEREAKHSGNTSPIRGISTSVFVRNLGTLAAFVRGSGK
jgi:hypothetical protein